ncbi:MAG: hypothetical protein IPG45_12575 [Deltaproteobacteria bacterium]|nr:hypothetical protein [Deltaproteobacteria bacterium]
MNVLLLVVGLNASSPVWVDLDPCLEQWVATASVAALLEVEFLPRPIELSSDAGLQVTCVDQRVEIGAPRGRWTFSIVEVSPVDRARALAVLLAEELRAEPPGAPRIEASPQLLPATSSSTGIAPAVERRWALLASTTLLKQLGDSSIAGALQASALFGGGGVRPRVGGGIWGAAAGSDGYFGAFVTVGADLALYQNDDWRFGLEASVAGGAFLEVEGDRALATSTSNTEVSSNTRLGPFALLTGGLFLERNLDDTTAINFELGVGTFVPAAPTALFSVGLRLDP